MWRLEYRERLAAQVRADRRTLVESEEKAQISDIRLQAAPGVADCARCCQVRYSSHALSRLYVSSKKLPSWTASAFLASADCCSSARGSTPCRISGERTAAEEVAVDFEFSEARRRVAVRSHSRSRRPAFPPAVSPMRR